MNRLFVGLILCFYGTICSSQQHFITAGQKTDMIHTQITPYRLLLGNQRDTIDINHDSVPDLEFNYITYTIFGGGVAGDSYAKKLFVNPLQSTTKINCKYDTSISFGFNDCRNYDTLFYHTSNYAYNDTIITKPGPIDTPTYILFRIAGFVGTCHIEDDSYNSRSYYISGELITNSDTLLFYVHLGDSLNQPQIFDYGCEGPTSTYVVTGLEKEISTQVVEIYPNPFNAELNVFTEHPFPYQITNLLGQELISGYTRQNNTTINTSSFAPGFYQLRVGNIVKRLVKQ